MSAEINENFAKNAEEDARVSRRTSWVFFTAGLTALLLGLESLDGEIDVWGNTGPLLELDCETASVIKIFGATTTLVGLIALGLGTSGRITANKRLEDADRYRHGEM